MKKLISLVVVLLFLVGCTAQPLNLSSIDSYIDLFWSDDVNKSLEQLEVTEATPRDNMAYIYDIDRTINVYGLDFDMALEYDIERDYYGAVMLETTLGADAEVAADKIDEVLDKIIADYGDTISQAPNQTYLGLEDPVEALEQSEILYPYTIPFFVKIRPGTDPDENIQKYQPEVDVKADDYDRMYFVGLIEGIRLNVDIGKNSEGEYALMLTYRSYIPPYEVLDS